MVEPTCHIQAYGEATAKLAGDALTDALAFETLASDPETRSHIPSATTIEKVRLKLLYPSRVAQNGMAGGQAIDLAAYRPMV